MAPNSVTGDESMLSGEINGNAKSAQMTPRKYAIAYRPVLTFAYIHIAGLYGLYLCFTSAKWATIAFGKSYMLSTHR